MGFAGQSSKPRSEFGAADWFFRALRRMGEAINNGVSEITKLGLGGRLQRRKFLQEVAEHTEES
jgi:hypothetical protein